MDELNFYFTIYLLNIIYCILLNSWISFFWMIRQYNSRVLFLLSKASYYYSMAIFSFISFYFSFAHIILRNINDRKIYISKILSIEFFFFFFWYIRTKHGLLFSISILLFEIFLICQFVFLWFYKEFLILIFRYLQRAIN